MRKITRWFVLSLLAAALPSAGVNLPLRIPFQGKLINPTGNNPKNGDIVMTFRIYDVPTGGTALFTEPMTVAVNNGVFAVQIGTSALLNTDLFSGASAYLGVTVAGGDAEMLPRQPLTMSPYAFTAMQLVSPQDIRVNAGISYSTFTAAGQLQLASPLAIAYGGTGQVTQTAAFDALSPLTTKGDVVVNNGTNDVRQPVGANRQVLAADSAQASGVKWVAGPTIVTLGADVNNNTTTPADVTGLSFPVLAGTTYYFEFRIVYDAFSTATGSRWAVRSSAATTLFAYAATYPLTGAITATTSFGNANDLPTGTSASSGYTTGNVAIITGVVAPSADGTVIARLTSELTTGGITAKAGSMVLYW